MTASLKDIAARVGVSSVAVSLALRGDSRISEARRRQIQVVADEVGYRPNSIARAMRTRRSHTVGLLLADLRTATSNLKIEGIEQQMTRHGHQLLLGFTAADGDRLIEYVDSMVARQVDGLLIFGPHRFTKSRNVWQRLHERFRDGDGPALILVDVQADTQGLFQQIGVDRGAAMQAAVNHLYSLGHRDILYVGPLAGSSLAKWEGVVEGVRATKDSAVRLRFAPLETELILESRNVARLRQASVDRDLIESSRLLDSVASAVDRIAQLPIAHRPTATIAASDLIAMTMIGRFADHGIVMPSDMSVIGFDGNDLARRAFRPRLTTLEQPQEALAEQVVEALLRRMSGQSSPLQTELLAAKLLKGDSTAAPRSASVARLHRKHRLAGRTLS